MEIIMAYLTESFVSAPSGIAVFKTVKLWVNAKRERNALRNMPYSRLEDIGVNPNAADREAHKSFWNVSSR